MGTTLKNFSLLILLCVISCRTQPEPEYPPWPLIWPVGSRGYWRQEQVYWHKQVRALERLRTSDIEYEKWNELMWIAQNTEVFCQVKLKEYDER